MKFALMLGVGLFSLLVSVAFEPFTIMAIIGGLILAGAVIAYLTIETVRSWLRQNRTWNRNKLGFLVKRAKQSGKMPVITGFFDEENEEITAEKDYLAEDVDSYISSLKTDVVYELK